MVLTILNNHKAFCKAGKQDYKQWLELQIEFMCIFSLRGHTDENGCQQYWQDILETQKTHLLLMLGTLGLITTFPVTIPSGWGLPRWR